MGVCAFAGLRAGELAALDWSDVDLAAATITVERSWDFKGRTFVAPKSRAGFRTVPVVGVLRDELVAHAARQGFRDGLVFGATPSEPFILSTVTRRAEKAWKDANKARAQEELPKLEPIGLHEARHSAATLWIESGVGPKRVSTWLGHADIGTTFNTYAKAFEARERSEADKVDEFIALANTAERIEQVSANS